MPHAPPPPPPPPPTRFSPLILQAGFDFARQQQQPQEEAPIVNSPFPAAVYISPFPQQYTVAPQTGGSVNNSGWGYGVTQTGVLINWPPDTTVLQHQGGSVDSYHFQTAQVNVYGGTYCLRNGHGPYNYSGQVDPLNGLVIYKSASEVEKFGGAGDGGTDVSNAKTGFPLPQPSNPLANSENMEVVWHKYFEDLFVRFSPTVWNLVPVLDSFLQKRDFNTFQDSAKVRFLCQFCLNAWTSMKGRVVFFFKFFPETNYGLVMFQLFGQKCRKCKPETFQHAMWYPEEVQKVVLNTFNAVGSAFFGFPQVSLLSVRRKGKPRAQHNASLCQACADNVCTEGKRVEERLVTVK